MQFSSYANALIGIMAAYSMAKLLPEKLGMTAKNSISIRNALACFALIFLAVNLPCMFRLGVEKGRLLFMAMIGVIVFFTMGFGDKIADGINKASAGGSLAPGAVAIAALALAANMASVALSERAYKRKMR